MSADNAGNQFSQVWSSKEPHLQRLDLTDRFLRVTSYSSDR
jgi:hypothetical protein